MPFSRFKEKKIADGEKKFRLRFFFCLDFGNIFVASKDNMEAASSDGLGSRGCLISKLSDWKFFTERKELRRRERGKGLRCLMS